MEIRATLGFLFIMSLLNNGAGALLNLENQAEMYLWTTFGHDKVESFGLTRNYPYWTEGHNHTGEYPINATVLRLQCDTHPVVVKRESMHPKQCEKMFIWKINKGLETPFALPVNVTIPMIQGSGKRQVQVDLNNRTLIIIKSKNSGQPASGYHLRSRQGGTWVRKVVRTCNFTAPTLFQGWFAFKLKHVRGDNPEWYAVQAGQLQNNSVGLHKEKNDVVAYNIRGQYYQISCQVGSGRPRGT